MLRNREIRKMIPTYQDIQARAEKSSPVKYHVPHNHAPLRMRNHNLPLSIKPAEFKFLYDFVSKHKLSKGYECATAFGISMLAPALAMKGHGGKLVTMDAYAEEHFQKLIHTGNAERQGKTFQNSDGFKSASWLVKEFGLEKVVTLTVGWSPVDTKKALEKTYDLSKDKLDYVFIDAEHIDSALVDDIKSIVPYLDNKFAIFVHDTHCFMGKAQDYVKGKFGKLWTIAKGCEFPHGNGYNLAYITNLE